MQMIAKSVFFLAFLGTSSLGLTADRSDPAASCAGSIDVLEELCGKVSEYAGAVMRVRFEGMPVAEALERHHRVNGGNPIADVLERIVLNAYGSTAYPDQSQKNRAISQFKEKWFRECKRLQGFSGLTRAK